MIQHRDCRRASCYLQQPTSTKQRQRKSYPRQGSCEVLPSPAQPPAFGCRPCAHLSQHFSCGQRDPNSLLPPAVPSQQGRALCRAPGTPKPGLETQRHKTRSFPSYSSWSHAPEQHLMELLSLNLVSRLAQRLPDPKEAIYLQFLRQRRLRRCGTCVRNSEATSSHVDGMSWAVPSTQGIQDYTLKAIFASSLINLV